MEKTIKIWLDEDLQVIRQLLTGDFVDADTTRLVTLTQACVDRLKNPEHVLILVDARELGRGNAKMRKLMLNELNRTNLKKMAFWGGSPLVRTALLFFRLANRTNKAYSFKTEAEAISWLQE
jgi:hypothetical protein